MSKIDLQAVAALLEQEEQRVEEFGRDTYASSFEAFLDNNKELWDSFRRLFLEEMNDEETEKAVADALIEKAQTIINAQTKRINKEKKQLNINLYMVSYVLPAIIECQGYQKKDSNACKMADAICQRWKEAFPKYAIQYSDFASIQSGFKQKLCYITTAICQGLHKTQNCQELIMMKKCRDEYLLHQPDGEQIVKEYYNIAPTIVKRIEKESAPEEKYQYLWEHYLKFCIAMIEAGQYQACREKYEEMVEELRKQYIITNHKEDM
ncbi:MAG: hypothetical protein IJO97_08060 [Lachnospiraceae bacterium]|nr:hypothetical protein [Lachnospiraceae bacterium]